MAARKKGSGAKGGSRQASKRKSSKAKSKVKPGGRATNLDCLFRPRSIAVVGASRNPHSIGYEIVANLVGQGFVGPVFPVNPKAKVVHSIPCYPTLEAIPEPIDLAIIVVPSVLVPKVVRSCAKKGVKGIVIISAGFREIGGKGTALEEEVIQICKKAGIRMIGPNCMGILNTEPETRMNASFAASVPIPGNIGFVSQSGALGEAILSDAREIGLGIRMFASVGNRADVGADDLCEYWANDPDVRLILLYLESFGEAEHFRRIAEELKCKKPIIAVKSGRTVSGARAAGSHTGSIAGEDKAVETFLFQTGVLRAESLREMFNLAGALLHQPIPQGDRVAVVTNAGGPGILATDALEGRRIPLATFKASTRKRLEAVLPSEATVQNPIDLIASAGPERYRKVLRAVVRDPGVDSLLVLFVSPVMIDAEAVARAILEETQGHGKPVVTCIMGKQRGDEAVELLKSAGIPVFSFPEEAADTISGLIRYRQMCARETGQPKTYRVQQKKAKRVLAKAAVDADGWIEGAAVRQILAEYGIPFVPTITVDSPEDGVAAAHRVGFPVAAKAVGFGLVHKTDLGAVAVGLQNGDEVFEIIQKMKRRLGRKHPGLRFEVQSMAKGHRELLLGFTRDPYFGPLFALGLGGVHVEVLKDVVVRLGPLRDVDPLQMMDGLRGKALLAPYRGAPGIDRGKVQEILLRLNQLAVDFPEFLECELNPLIAGQEGVPTVAVDARIRL